MELDINVKVYPAIINDKKLLNVSIHVPNKEFGTLKFCSHESSLSECVQGAIKLLLISNKTELHSLLNKGMDYPVSFGP